MGGSIILSIIAALCLLLAFPPFNLYPCIYIAPIFLISDCLNASSASSAFKKGLTFGLIFMGLFHIWMFSLTPWASIWGIAGLWLIFTLYLALFYAVIATCIYWVRASYWVIPVVWTGMEYLKTLGPIGNPSGTIGYAQTSALPILQLASFGGIYFVSFFTICVATLLLSYLLPLPHQPSKPIRTTALIGLLSLFVLGVITYTKPIAPGPTLRVTAVQPNHAQKDKLSLSKWQDLRISCVQINEQLLKTTPTSLVFWPETITPGLNLGHPIFVEDLRYLCDKHNVSIIFGTPILRNNHYFNSVAAISKTGINPQTYDKVFLMPFGEYWPGRHIFRSLGLQDIIPETDFTAGHTHRLIPITISPNMTINIGSAICLESIYPSYFLRSTNVGADLLYTAVNNAWFFKSSVAQKHLQMTQVRAIENNRYVIQAANTGISAIISPKGTILQSVPLDTLGYITQPIGLLKTKTLYSKLQENWLFGLILATCLGLMWQNHFKKPS